MKHALYLTSTPLPPHLTSTPHYTHRSHMPRGWYRARWAMWYPLQWRLLWGYTTFGELLFLVAILGAAAGISAAVMNQTNGSGKGGLMYMAQVGGD